MSIFTGAAVAIVTPFTEDNKVNFEELGRIIDDQIARGTDAIVICGTTGEASTLSHEEHLEAIAFACKHTNKRVPVIAGTGSNCTETAVYLSVEAEKLGADALLLVTPYYNKATQNGLFKMFSKVAESVNIPIILYNVPGRTGCNILPETAVRLAKANKNIVAIKEASGNISQIAKLAALADGCIDIYSGNDDQIVPILSLGGKGVISVLSNVAPEMAHNICQEYFDGNVKKSCELQLKALPLVAELFNEVNPIPVKAAMKLQGWATGDLRGPLCWIEPAHEEALAKAMKEAGVL